MKIICYQQKKNYFIHEMFYTNLMATTKQKSKEGKQIIKRKLRKTSEKSSNQNGRQKHRGKETMEI